MENKLIDLLKELEQFSVENDARVKNRAEKMLNITPDTGPFLVLLIRALNAKRVLEIGTSNGYSTLWLAHAVRPLGGVVTTVEISPLKADLARRNFARAQFNSLINLEVMDALDFLGKQPDEVFDFVFLDSYRVEYPVWWRDLQRVITPGALLVCDNALTHAHEMKDFLAAVHQTSGYITSTVAVGHGQLVILKQR
jgi:predicted O-methyltransferase YrrM